MTQVSTVETEQALFGSRRIKVANLRPILDLRPSKCSRTNTSGNYRCSSCKTSATTLRWVSHCSPHRRKSKAWDKAGPSRLSLKQVAGRSFLHTVF
ncbi:hypothetical protein BDR22DRAFT_464504 [Usnea florida]